MAHKKDSPRSHFTVFCCEGSDCKKHGARETLKELRQEVRQRGLKGQVQFVKTHCMDACKHGPVVVICSGCLSVQMNQEQCAEQNIGSSVCGAIWYRHLKAKHAAALIEAHIEGGQPLELKQFRTGEDPEIRNDNEPTTEGDEN